MVERGQVKKTLRAVLFCILLIVYYLMYMQTAVDQYYKEKTTMAQYRINMSHLNPPVIVACADPPFKTSFFKEHGFNKTGEIRKYFWMFRYWKNKLKTTFSTEEEMYMNMSYHLGSDWRISFQTLKAGAG
jgi:hypothetical protein